jgi:hypothetical protein
MQVGEIEQRHLAHGPESEQLLLSRPSGLGEARPRQSQGRCRGGNLQKFATAQAHSSPVVA